MVRIEDITANVQRVRERIAEAAARVSRSPDEITLVAVTKTHPPAVIEAAAAAGVVDFGENRVQEAQQKVPSVAVPNLRWHLIGHLQRNKVRKAVQLFDLIHSVDSLRLAQALDRIVAEESGPTPQRRLPVLLQLNIAGEEQKEVFDLQGGLANRDASGRFYDEVAQIIALPHLRVDGLMTIGPYVAEAEVVRPVFRALREVRDELAIRFPQVAWRELSMGMTNDFEVAIEEGATIVRVGRAIFGLRQ